MSTAVIFDLLLILFFDLNATLFTCPRLLYHWQHCFLSRDTETSSQDKLGVHTRSVPIQPKYLAKLHHSILAHPRSS